MNIAELNSKLRLAQLHPIKVEGNPFTTDREALKFQGTLEEYFEAVKSLGISGIFIFTSILEERHFWYAPEDTVPIIEEEISEEPEEFDLCKIEPVLTEYKKKYLGEIGVFKLSAISALSKLDFYLFEDWWLKFNELSDQIGEKIDAQKESAFAESKAEMAANNERLSHLLNQLIKDENFVRLTTQRAMREYALDKIPELEKLDGLSFEIQDLHAKIKAKGLDRKRRT